MSLVTKLIKTRRNSHRYFNRMLDAETLLFKAYEDLHSYMTDVHDHDCDCRMCEWMRDVNAYRKKHIEDQL